MEWSTRRAGRCSSSTDGKDFHRRSTSLSFGWFNSKADLTLTLEYEQRSEGGRLSMLAAKVFERPEFGRGPTVGRYRFEPRGAQYRDQGNWPNGKSPES